MYLIIFAFFALAAGADCKSFIISGPGWNNEIKSCASGGEHHHPITFYLGKLSDSNVTRADISIASTTVMAEGNLQLMTMKEGWVPRSQLHLSEASVSSDYVQFKGNWRLESKRGWGSQIVYMELTVKFYDDKIYMDSYVSAGSWMSVTCSQTRAFVERIKVAL